MKIELHLPEFTADSSGYMGPDYNPGLCDGCGNERYGLMAKLLPFGWLHAEDEDCEVTCLQKAVDSLAAPDMTGAWVAVAQHVAKYPTKHSAATIRSVISELAKVARARPRPARE